jgi:uncharacterized protein
LTQAVSPAVVAPWPWFVLAGVGVGGMFGLFGVGGGSLATPVLALLGVPGLQAVASPLPATVPAALSGAYAYVRNNQVRPRLTRRSLLGAVPATVAGALLSPVVGGHALLVASGIVLGIVGIRILRPVTEADQRAGTERRQHAWLVVLATAAVGLFTGLLANSGGFLLIPLYLLALGVPMREAVGTSLVVVSALSVPTLVTHWFLGHIDWPVALSFAAGAIPGALVGGKLAQRVVEHKLRTAFGWLLIVFSIAFTMRQITSA